MFTSWAMWMAIAFTLTGFLCSARVFPLYFSSKTDARTKAIEERINYLTKQLDLVQKKITSLKKQRNQSGKACEVSDIEWYLDDNMWRLQDIEWEIRDSQWEKTAHINERKTSQATFWTAAGALFFALAGLVLGFGK
jgi:septal ring factor EnvC (AmiA/AmiB activator)